MSLEHVHDLHVWTITSNLSILSTLVVIDDSSTTTRRPAGRVRQGAE